MTGDDILKLASDLFLRNKSPSEALCRNIIGRAYYGAFHLSNAFLARLGLTEKELKEFKENKKVTASGHKAPARWLERSDEPSAKRVGKLLDDLYAARRRADYNLDGPQAITDSRDWHFVKSQIELADTIKSLHNSCEKEPKRAEVLKGISSIRSRA